MAVVKLLWIVLVAWLPSFPADSPQSSDYVGVWDTELGRLELDLLGSRLLGRCSGPNYMDPLDDSRLWGTVEEGELQLEYTAPQGPGTARLRIGEDGGLVGSWTAAGPQGGGGAWNGVAVEGCQPASPYAGLWETNLGRLRLSGPSQSIVGVYESGFANALEGSVRDGVLYYTYTENGEKGSGEFRLADNGGRVSGHWTPAGEKGRYPWFGQRVVADPEAVWLVVLEAPWEENLREPEYAFGDMLRGYFKMATGQHIRVRQRSFHDQQDFERFAFEVNFLAEPTVLVIASHGLPSGIAVNDSLIGPNVVGKTLRAAEHVRLLHLSGCSLMGGEFSSHVHEAIGSRSCLPISGYATEVAWDTSAIGDFVFLSMILLRGLDPQAALEQSHRAAAFTGPATLPSEEFAGLGLTLRLPPAAGRLKRPR